MKTAKWVILVLDDPQMSGVEIYGVIKSQTRIFEVGMIYTGKDQEI